jgi:hypothetical protein
LSEFDLEPSGAVVFDDTKNCSVALADVFQYLQKGLIVLPPASMGPDLLCFAKKNNDRLLVSIQLKQQTRNPLAEGFCSLNPILWFAANRLERWKQTLHYGNKFVRDFFVANPDLRPRFLCIYASNRKLQAGPTSTVKEHSTTHYSFALMSFGENTASFGSVSKTAKIAISGWRAPWAYDDKYLVEGTPAVSALPARADEGDVDENVVHKAATVANSAKIPKSDRAPNITDARHGRVGAEAAASTPNVRKKAKKRAVAVVAEDGQRRITDMLPRAGRPIVP